MKKYDVVALGELLVDFTENGMSTQGNPLFEANPGGAPCNVLSMLQKLGSKTAFIGKVGKDSFGEMLRNVVAEQGIDTVNLLMDETKSESLNIRIPLSERSTKGRSPSLNLTDIRTIWST